MPCDSSHLNPNQYEYDLSGPVCVLEELAGRKVRRRDYSGYHPKVYNTKITQDRIDKTTAKACRALKKRGGADGLSLEAQVWWRDHQEQDKRRASKEREDIRIEKLKKQALKKLTRAERKALGVK